MKAIVNIEFGRAVMELSNCISVDQLGYQNPTLDQDDKYMLWGNYYALTGDNRFDTEIADKTYNLVMA